VKSPAGKAKEKLGKREKRIGFSGQVHWLAIC